MMSQLQPQFAGSLPATSRAGWVAVVLVGSIITMVAGGLLVGGIVTATLMSSQRDGNYLLTPPRQLSSQAYAITTPSAALETSLDRLSEIRVAITAASEDESEIFIGIAPSADVADGLVLVKGWLLAIPHLLVLGILVVIAAVILLFTGRYQRSLFDLIMGINRWAYRATTYVALVRDEYPPFRVDQGGRDPEVALPRMDQL